MYHQFKELADIDITTTPMEIGPTTHYIMGASGWTATPRCRPCQPLCCRRVRRRPAWRQPPGGNSLSDLLVFGKRAGEFAAAYAREHGPVAIDGTQVEEAERAALAPFERVASVNGSGAYQVQQELQSLMQELVGIVRNEPEMKQALEGIEQLKDRAAAVGVVGNREYNPGWHTAIDLANLLTISEAITRSAIDRKESRGGHFREDYRRRIRVWQDHLVIRKGPDGEMQLVREPIPEMPAELTGHRGTEVTFTPPSVNLILSVAKESK